MSCQEINPKKKGSPEQEEIPEILKMLDSATGNKEEEGPLFRFREYRKNKPALWTLKSAIQDLKNAKSEKRSRKLRGK